MQFSPQLRAEKSSVTFFVQLWNKSRCSNEKALDLVIFIVHINTWFEIECIACGEGYNKFHSETSRFIK
jgi:hypothetical protein